MIRVAIVDDHVIVRTGLKYLIESDPELEFAGEFGRGEGAADFVAQSAPDVTLLDVRMPDKNGIEVLREIVSANPKARVVMLTTSDVEEDVFRAIEEGAMGYVIKDSPVEIIAAAIRSAVAGDVYMTDEIRRIYETRKGVKGLSPREAEVIAIAAKGCGNREIGQRLGISENSVKIHLKRAYFKLGASDRAEAVTIAMQRGFIPAG
jgi:DNA-binding NarL/FixJ family response regulator